MMMCTIKKTGSFTNLGLFNKHDEIIKDTTITKVGNMFVCN